MKLEKAQHFPRSAHERALNLGRPHMGMVTYNVENLFRRPKAINSFSRLIFKIFGSSLVTTPSSLKKCRPRLWKAPYCQTSSRAGTGRHLDHGPAVEELLGSVIHAGYADGSDVQSEGVQHQFLPARVGTEAGLISRLFGPDRGHRTKGVDPTAGYFSDKIEVFLADALREFVNDGAEIPRSAVIHVLHGIHAESVDICESDPERRSREFDSPTPPPPHAFDAFEESEPILRAAYWV